MTENVLDASLQSASSPMRQDTRKADFDLDKLKKRLRRLVGQAIADYSMIDANDRVMMPNQIGPSIAPKSSPE